MKSLQASFLRLLQEEIAKMSTEREEKSEREERWFKDPKVFFWGNSEDGRHCGILGPKIPYSWFAYLHILRYCIFICIKYLFMCCI